MAAVQHILGESRGPPTIVFGRTRRQVSRLGSRLKDLGLRVDSIQGAMPQQARSRVIQRLRAAQIDVLVATNVAARGLDIAGLARVINYDVPDDPNLFTHRTGRTGRMGGVGRSITLVSGADLNALHAIERVLGNKLVRRRWDDIQGRERCGEWIDQGRSQWPHAPRPGVRRNRRPRWTQGAARRAAQRPVVSGRWPGRKNQGRRGPVDRRAEEGKEGGRAAALAPPPEAIAEYLVAGRCSASPAISWPPLADDSGRGTSSVAQSRSLGSQRGAGTAGRHCSAAAVMPLRPVSATGGMRRLPPTR